MAELSPKIRTVQTGYCHWCPGCEDTHILPTGWSYQAMETDKPTATPSFKHTWSKDRCCHYHLTDGVLIFYNDSTHGLKGQRVPLPDIPAEDRLGMPGCE